jgi:hypothetical protein
MRKDAHEVVPSATASEAVSSSQPSIRLIVGEWTGNHLPNQESLTPLGTSPARGAALVLVR